MGYQIFKFGSLLVNSEQFNPGEAPANGNGFMSVSLNFADTPNSPTQTLTWIQPDGCKFLICDRVLLTGTSWARLQVLDYDGGKKVSIDGNIYYVRMPTRKEWKAALRSCGVITNSGMQRKGGGTDQSTAAPVHIIERIVPLFVDERHGNDSGEQNYGVCLWRNLRNPVCGIPNTNNSWLSANTRS